MYLITHRWRDVKLRAFENADHRTYVDLKVKNINHKHIKSQSSLTLQENVIFFTGQMEDAGSHSKYITAAKKRRAGATRTARQSVEGIRVLVAAPRETSGERST